MRGNARPARSTHRTVLAAVALAFGLVVAEAAAADEPVAGATVPNAAAELTPDDRRLLDADAAELATPVVLAEPDRLEALASAHAGHGGAATSSVDAGRTAQSGGHLYAVRASHS